jgi:hypothetical protein
MEGGRTELGYPTITLNDHLANETVCNQSQRWMESEHGCLRLLLCFGWHSLIQFFFSSFHFIVSFVAEAPHSWLGGLPTQHSLHDEVHHLVVHPKGSL